MGSMPQKVRLEPGSAPAPLTGHAELIRAHLAHRRQELQRYSPAALDLAAAGLAGAHDAAYMHMRALRGDRDERFRRYQLTGERGLPLEDLACIALEGELGAAVALPILREFARALGYELRPVAGEALPQAEAKAQLLLATAGLIAALDRFMADGRLDATERVQALEGLNAVKARVASLEASLVEDPELGRTGLHGLAGGRA